MSDYMRQLGQLVKHGGSLVCPTGHCDVCGGRLEPTRSWSVPWPNGTETLCENCARFAAAYGVREWALAMGGDGGPGGWSFFTRGEEPFPGEEFFG